MKPGGLPAGGQERGSVSSCSFYFILPFSFFLILMDRTSVLHAGDAWTPLNRGTPEHAGRSLCFLSSPSPGPPCPEDGSVSDPLIHSFFLKICPL